jgi:hypothetical protein
MLEKNTHISKFLKIHPVGAEVCHADGGALRSYSPFILIVSMHLKQRKNFKYLGLLMSILPQTPVERRKLCLFTCVVSGIRVAWLDYQCNLQCGVKLCKLGVKWRSVPNGCCYAAVNRLPDGGWIENVILNKTRKPILHLVICIIFLIRFHKTCYEVPI